MEKQSYETALDLICEQHDTIRMLERRITELEGLDDGLLMSQESEEPDTDEWGFRKHRVSLTDRTIIELAYLTRDLIGPLAKDHTKLMFEEANCYTACFYHVCEMLKLVDPEYKASHHTLMDFYQEGRRLLKANDRLYWEKVTSPDDASNVQEGCYQEEYHESELCFEHGQWCLSFQDVATGNVYQNSDFPNAFRERIKNGNYHIVDKNGTPIMTISKQGTVLSSNGHHLWLQGESENDTWQRIFRDKLVSSQRYHIQLEDENIPF